MRTTRITLISVLIVNDLLNIVGKDRILEVKTHGLTYSQRSTFVAWGGDLHDTVISTRFISLNRLNILKGVFYLRTQLFSFLFRVIGPLLPGGGAKLRTPPTSPPRGLNLLLVGSDPPPLEG